MGRMQCIGLAADGEDGVVRMLELLEQEVRICMGLLGVNTLAELNPSYVRSAYTTVPAHALSAFPLVSLADGSLY
jgi:glycolate oxidase